MFSATMPEGIEALVQSVLRDHIKVSIGVTGAGASTINQKLLFVGREEGKLLAMRQLATEVTLLVCATPSALISPSCTMAGSAPQGLKPPVLVFMQSKERAQELYNELRYDNINVDVIHAGRSQAQRDAAVRDFRTGQTWVLITTDLMCRGMDFKGVNLVINYDFPQARSHAPALMQPCCLWPYTCACVWVYGLQSGISYVHRIGRTGRAGRPGEAVTFFTESDMDYLRGIANIMRISGCDVPQWMLSMKKLRYVAASTARSLGGYVAHPVLAPRG